METPPVTIKKAKVNSLTKSCHTPCRRVGLSRPSSASLKKTIQVKTINIPVNTTTSPENSNLINFPLVNSQNETPLAAANKQLKVPFRSSDSYNKSVDFAKVRRCLSGDLKTPQSPERRTTVEIEKSNLPLDPNIDSETRCNSTKHQAKKRKLNLQPSCKNEKGVKKSSSESSHECKLDFLGIGKTKDGAVTETTITQTTIQELASSILEKRKKLEQLKVQGAYAKKHNLEELRSQTAIWRAAGQEALRYCSKLATEAGHSVTICQLMRQHGFPIELMGYNEEDDEFD